MIPRTYVSTLEAQIAKLTRENEELRAQALTNEAQNQTDATSPTDSQDWMASN